jgi:L-asparaginase
LVVLNDEISGAREVTKTNTYRVETFRAPELGFLGYVDADKVTFYRASTRRHTARTEFDVSGVKQLPKVDILYSYIEPTTETLTALVKTGVRGVVFAGAGAGGLSNLERGAVKSIAAWSGPRPVFVRSSRTGNGRVSELAPFRQEYEAWGVVAADNLNPQKARVLLMLALTKTTDIDEIKRMFTEY